MPSITCNCGFIVEDKDHFMVEAKAWHHAIKDHLEMLKGLTLEQIDAVIRNNDQQMGIK